MSRPESTSLQELNEAPGAILPTNHDGVFILTHMPTHKPTHLGNRGYAIMST